jgi:hypothetical protein
VKVQKRYAESRSRDFFTCSRLGEAEMANYDSAQSILVAGEGGEGVLLGAGEAAGLIGRWGRKCSMRATMDLDAD